MIHDENGHHLTVTHHTWAVAAGLSGIVYQTLFRHFFIPNSGYGWHQEKDVEVTDIYTFNDSLATMHQHEIDQLRQHLQQPKANP